MKNSVIPADQSGKSIFTDHDNMNNRRVAGNLELFLFYFFHHLYKTETVFFTVFDNAQK